jgi:hypothetical protein
MKRGEGGGGNVIKSAEEGSPPSWYVTMLFFSPVKLSKYYVTTLNINKKDLYNFCQRNAV